MSTLEPLDDAKWYTTTETGRYLHDVSRQTVIGLIQSGHLRASVLKRRRKISGKEIRRYLSAAEKRAAV